MSVPSLGMGRARSVGHSAHVNVASRDRQACRMATQMQNVRPMTAQIPLSHANRTASRTFLTVIQQYQQGVTLTLGKVTAVKDPGLRVAIPVFQKVLKIDMRTDLIALHKQEVITKDNVSIMVDAVVQFRVTNARKVVCAINRYKDAISELAQLKLREVLSHSDVNSILHDRTKFSAEILKGSKEQAEKWGIELEAISIKDIKFCHEGVVRAMAKGAEAEREAEAQVIAAKAEVRTAAEYSTAAATLASNPIALKLREFETMLQIAKERGTTFVFYPSDALSKLRPDVKNIQEAIKSMEQASLVTAHADSLKHPKAQMAV
jgi:regulator of protease activity HflC (stomatin/prohibitin superfamily)